MLWRDTSRARGVPDGVAALVVVPPVLPISDSLPPIPSRGRRKVAGARGAALERSDPRGASVLQAEVPGPRRVGWRRRLWRRGWETTRRVARCAPDESPRHLAQGRAAARGRRKVKQGRRGAVSTLKPERNLRCGLPGRKLQSAAASSQRRRARARAAPLARGAARRQAGQQVSSCSGPLLVKSQAAPAPGSRGRFLPSGRLPRARPSANLLSSPVALPPPAAAAVWSRGGGLEGGGGQ